MIDCVSQEIKTCFFGYGGIEVLSPMQCIILIGIKPPMGAGTYLYDENGAKIGDWERTGKRLEICFNSLDEVETFGKLLNNIERNCGGYFKFHDIIFDFTEYKQASMDVMKRAVKNVQTNFIMLMAC